MTESIDRFHGKYEPNENDCWIWTGAKNRDGYGSFWNGERLAGRNGKRGGPRMVLAHRWSFAHFIGAIPAGLYVLHRCDTPSCVNPDHLFLGTQADNVRDCANKGRRNQRRAKKPKVPCVIEGCGDVAICRGMCNHHYHRWYERNMRDRSKNDSK